MKAYEMVLKTDLLKACMMVPLMDSELDCWTAPVMAYQMVATMEPRKEPKKALRREKLMAERMEPQ